ncbi:transposase [Komagataeibacter intermedius TF2]|uniref:Transposase n=1 Tax=Komagataeibacter intermedius NRIC 0521 TaxID=1307934 RepID=A0ABQ0PKW6_9PROT|nr:transposase [Komagataeibacter intermedius TF2]GBQ74856.1 transposase [Komagataeibacter intermedius NRIC 0521]
MLNAGRGHSFPNPRGGLRSDHKHRSGTWRSFEAVEYAILEGVDWFNKRRILDPVGNITQAEAKQHFYAAMDQILMAA